MFALIKKILGVVDRGDSEKILSRSMMIFALNAGSIFFGFLISVVLAKSLGPEGYGTYAYVFTWVNLLSMLLLLGIDKVLVRELAKLFTDGNWPAIKGLYRWSGKRVFLASSLAGVVMLIVALPFTGIVTNENIRIGFYMAAVAIPVFSMSLHRQATLQGIKEVVRGQFPDKLVLPFVTLAVTSVLWLTDSPWLTVKSAMFINLCSFVLTFFTGQAILNWKFPKKAVVQKPTAIERKEYMALAFSMFLYNGTNMLNGRADILLLGSLSSEEAVGIYNVALKLAMFISFFLVAFNAVIAPSISSFFHQRKMQALQNLGVKSSRIIAVCSVPIGLILLFGGKYILEFYGVEYLPGHFALVLLSLAQLFSVLAGPAGMFLLMTGHQKQAFQSMVVSLLLNIVLNVSLVPILGLNGAAIATATSLVVGNILKVYFVLTKLKINPTIFGKIVKT